MYTPINGCAGLLHLLLKHPILTIIMGLTAATGFINNQMNGKEFIEEVEQQPAFAIKLAELGPGEAELAKSAPSMFAHIVAAGKKAAQINKSNIEEVRKEVPEALFARIVTAESDVTSVDVIIPGDDMEEWFRATAKIANNKNWNTVHPDGVSHGPSGLTPIALREVKEKIGECYAEEEILNDPELNLKYGYLYFLQMLHRFKNEKAAIIAYNQGPTKTARMIREGKPLPEKYYKTVMRVQLTTKE